MNLQRTPLDDVCSNRIHEKTDKVMGMVMEELGLPIEPFTLVRGVKVSVDVRLKSKSRKEQHKLHNSKARGEDVDAVTNIDVDAACERERDEYEVVRVRVEGFDPDHPSVPHSFLAAVGVEERGEELTTHSDRFWGVGDEVESLKPRERYNLTRDRLAEEPMEYLADCLLKGVGEDEDDKDVDEERKPRSDTKSDWSFSVETEDQDVDDAGPSCNGLDEVRVGTLLCRFNGHYAEPDLRLPIIVGGLPSSEINSSTDYEYATQQNQNAFFDAAVSSLEELAKRGSTGCPTLSRQLISQMLRKPKPTKYSEVDKQNHHVVHEHEHDDCSFYTLRSVRRYKISYVPGVYEYDENYDSDSKKRWKVEPFDLQALKQNGVKNLN